MPNVRLIQLEEHEQVGSISSFVTDKGTTVRALCIYTNGQAPSSHEAPQKTTRTPNKSQYWTPETDKILVHTYLTCRAVHKEWTRSAARALGRSRGSVSQRILEIQRVAKKENLSLEEVTTQHLLNAGFYKTRRYNHDV